MQSCLCLQITKRSTITKAYIRAYLKVKYLHFSSYFVEVSFLELKVLKVENVISSKLNIKARSPSI